MIKFFSIMTEENKKLLFSDLSGRVLYNPKIRLSFDIHHIDDLGEETIEHQEENGTLIAAIHYDDGFIVLNESHNWFDIENVKPYLRPMSSMTEEERIEFSKLLAKRYCEEDWEGHISTSYCIEIDNVYTDDSEGIKYPSSFSMKPIDWLNSHYFDYRGLIEKELAIEVTEENNPYNNK